MMDGQKNIKRHFYVHILLNILYTHLEMLNVEATGLYKIFISSIMAKYCILIHWEKLEAFI
jgi:hypothetical protein